MCGDFQGERKLRISAKMRKNGSTVYIALDEQICYQQSKFRRDPE